MRTLTLRAQAKPTTLSLRCSLLFQQGFWHAQVLESQVSARSRSTRPFHVRTACSVHTGFHQQRLAADVRTGTKGADYKPLDVEIRSDSSARIPTQSFILHTLLYFLLCLKGDQYGSRASSCRVVTRSQFLCIPSGTCLRRPGQLQLLNVCSSTANALAVVVLKSHHKFLNMRANG